MPLSDIVENRKLVLTCSFLTLIGIIDVACSRSAAAFLCFALMIGVFSSGAQVLIPYLSHLILEARRGRIFGSIMAGIVASIMFARPFALFVSAVWEMARGLRPIRRRDGSRRRGALVDDASSAAA